MSSSHRYGAFDTINGLTASEMVQARTDGRTESIRRPGVKIEVMSEEEWQRKWKISQRRYAAELAAETKEQESRSEANAAAVAALLQVYDRQVRRQRAYEDHLAGKLKAYHEKPDDDATPSATWKAVYKETARFLAAAMVAYHYQLDLEKGTVCGPDFSKLRWSSFDPDLPVNGSLPAYMKHRRVEISEDEAAYFRGLVNQKADFPIFLLAAVGDNLQRLSGSSEEDATSNNAAYRSLLEFIMDDDLIREEIVDTILGV